MTRIKFNEERCKGCSLCVSVCPRKLLRLDGARINGKGYNPVQITDREKCNECGMCATICPDVVITIGEH